MSRAHRSKPRCRPGLVAPLALMAVGIVCLSLARVAWLHDARGQRGRPGTPRAVASRSTPTARPHAAPGPWVVNPSTGHEYAVVDAGSWAQCDAAASRAGGHLVTIDDAHEQAWLEEQFGTTSRYWIGLTDAGGEGKWQWVTGEPLSYTNWAVDEPNDYGPGGEDYAHMGPLPGGAWNDLGPDSTQWRSLTRAIVERPERVIDGVDFDGRRPDRSLRVELLRAAAEGARDDDARARLLYLGAPTTEPDTAR